MNLKKFENISFEETAQICEGVELARRLVAAPPNSLTPQEMSITASQIAKHNPSTNDRTISGNLSFDLRPIKLAFALVLTKGPLSPASEIYG